jgi:hypothetical protein
MQKSSRSREQTLNLDFIDISVEKRDVMAKLSKRQLDSSNSIEYEIE